MQPSAGVSNISDGTTNGSEISSDNQDGFSRGVEGSSKMFTSNVENGVKRKKHSEADSNSDSDSDSDHKRAKDSPPKEVSQVFNRKANLLAKEAFKDAKIDMDISEMNSALQRDFSTLMTASIKWKIIGLVGRNGQNWNPEIKAKVEKLLRMMYSVTLDLYKGTPLPDFKNLFLNFPKEISDVLISEDEDEDDLASNPTDSGSRSTSTSETRPGAETDAAKQAEPHEPSVPPRPNLEL